MFTHYFYLQLRGHQRSPSNTQAFRERTKKDALNHLENELDRLLGTAPEPLKDSFRQEFNGFTHLFKRFVKEEGPSLEWDRIQKLPENAVCIKLNTYISEKFLFFENTYYEYFRYKITVIYLNQV